MQLQWYDDNADNTPWLKALAEVRHRATREGCRYQHVQAIIVAIDQYAEAALGNRDFFLNKPQSIGGTRKSKDAGQLLKKETAPDHHFVTVALVIGLLLLELEAVSGAIHNGTEHTRAVLAFSRRALAERPAAIGDVAI